jgi:hypothetical protein
MNHAADDMPGAFANYIVEAREHDLQLSLSTSGRVSLRTRRVGGEIRIV